MGSGTSPFDERLSPRGSARPENPLTGIPLSVGWHVELHRMRNAELGEEARAQAAKTLVVGLAPPLDLREAAQATVFTEALRFLLASPYQQAGDLLEQAFVELGRYPHTKDGLIVNGKQLAVATGMVVRDFSAALAFLSQQAEAGDTFQTRATALCALFVDQGSASRKLALSVLNHPLGSVEEQQVIGDICLAIILARPSLLPQYNARAPAVQPRAELSDAEFLACVEHLVRRPLLLKCSMYARDDDLEPLLDVGSDVRIKSDALQTLRAHLNPQREQALRELLGVRSNAAGEVFSLLAHSPDPDSQRACQNAFAIDPTAARLLLDLREYPDVREPATRIVKDGTRSEQARSEALDVFLAQFKGAAADRAFLNSLLADKSLPAKVVASLREAYEREADAGAVDSAIANLRPLTTIGARIARSVRSLFRDPIDLQASSSQLVARISLACVAIGVSERPDARAALRRVMRLEDFLGLGLPPQTYAALLLGPHDRDANRWLFSSRSNPAKGRLRDMVSIGLTAIRSAATEGNTKAPLARAFSEWLIECNEPSFPKTVMVANAPFRALTAESIDQILRERFARADGGQAVNFALSVIEGGLRSRDLLEPAFRFLSHLDVERLTKADVSAIEVRLRAVRSQLGCVDAVDQATISQAINQVLSHVR